MGKAMQINENIEGKNWQPIIQKEVNNTHLESNITMITD